MGPKFESAVVRDLWKIAKWGCLIVILLNLAMLGLMLLSSQCSAGPPHHYTLF
jgi:hypothetical protein